MLQLEAENGQENIKSLSIAKDPKDFHKNNIVNMEDIKQENKSKYKIFSLKIELKITVTF
jgi:hypothetical protein